MGRSPELLEAFRRGAKPDELFDQAWNALFLDPSVAISFEQLHTAFSSLFAGRNSHYSHLRFSDIDPREEAVLVTREIRLKEGRGLDVKMSRGFLEADETDRAHLLIATMVRVLVRSGGIYADLIRRGQETLKDMIIRHQRVYAATTTHR